MSRGLMRNNVLDVELTSAEIETILGISSAKGIYIRNLRKESDLTYCFQVKLEDYRILNRICIGRGAAVKIRKKRGPYWYLINFCHRPVFLFGLMLLIVFTVFLPSRVLFVRVEGNKEIPARKIIDVAQNCGIGFGASRRMVRSEKMKNALLSALPQLQWAGVNTEGCTAIISVREGIKNKDEDLQEPVSSIVASQDGYILSGTVLRGTALFRPGQAVSAGQVLISGYTDCGIYIQATQAEGEIMAQTTRHLEALTLSEYCQKGRELAKKRKYSLVIRKKRINLWKDSGISDGIYGRIYKEYYFMLPGGFKLPLSFCVEEFTEYERETSTLSLQSAEASLSAFADRYLNGLMIAGTIVDKTETVFREGEHYHLDGSYTCVEMIGREVKEQIGEANGKTN